MCNERSQTNFISKPKATHVGPFLCWLLNSVLCFQSACDGQSSCSYLYEGQVIEGCTLNYTADYVNLIYHCTGAVL